MMSDLCECRLAAQELVIYNALYYKLAMRYH